MKNTPFISIIMPVYNNERLLPNAINSILNQSFTDWELIIVDDGSTDNTPAVADSFAEKDSRIKVIHQENQWIFKSYNNGIAASSGDYVLIVNSDDTINPDSLSRINEAATKDSADLIVFNMVANYCNDDQIIINENIYGYKDLLKQDFSYTDIDLIHREWINLIKLKLLNHQCVYKSSIAKNIKYRTDVYASDYFYNIEIADYIKVIAGTSYNVYNYFIYPSEHMNASIGKYYGYEHEMFNEIYSAYKALFLKWNIFDASINDFLTELRLSFLTAEIRTYLSPQCKLTVDEKLKRIIDGISDDIVYINSQASGRIEELESRTLSGLRELFLKDIPDISDKYYFMFEMLESLLRYEKDKDDIIKIENAVNHPLNPKKIGLSFYTKCLSTIE